MFVEDIKNDFYNLLLGNRVLLLVHYDVDAICTCKIIQGLFKSDNISYTLVPVGGISELKTAYEENSEEIKFVVLINCGGTIDLVDILQPEEDVVFFVLDAHKPTDVCNVYSDGQVRLVYKDDEENIPNFDDIFRDDEEEDESEGAESGREGAEARVERRRERRAWEERRNTLMFNYTQFSYYGKPSACVMLELSWRLSRRSGAGVWAGAVGAAAAGALALRSPARCLLDTDQLALHHINNQPHAECRITLEKDLNAPLYRVWSLEEALCHSPSIAPQLRLHSLSGASRLRQLLADMGIPLQQARQSYRSMDVELRRTLLEALEAAATKHKLTNTTHTTFILHPPHAPPIPALDIVYSIMALIEHESVPRGEGFQLSLSALCPTTAGAAARRAGAAGARAALTAVRTLMVDTLRNRLTLAGPFAYFIVQEGTPAASAVKGPLWLGVAARWAGGGAGGGRPVLASAAHSAHSALLLGVPPRFLHEPRNLFGAAFEQAAARSGATVSLDYVDTSVVSLPIAQRTLFLDALTALLA